jgi:hypothetical protein
MTILNDEACSNEACSGIVLGEVVGRGHLKIVPMVVEAGIY